MAAERELNCLICGSSLLEGRLVKCPSCATAHHEECWEYNAGCALYGCSQAVSVREPQDALPGKQAPARPAPVPTARPNRLETWRNIMVPVIAVAVLRMFGEQQPATPPAKPAPAVAPAKKASGPRSHNHHPVQSNHVNRLAAEWELELEGKPNVDAVATPVSDFNPVIVLAARSTGARVYAIDSISGGQVWSRDIPTRDSGSNIVAAALRERVAILTREAQVLILDRRTGEEIERIPVPKTPDEPKILGIDHDEVSLGGPGLVVEVKAARAPQHPQDRTRGIGFVAGVVPFTCRVLGAGRGVAVTEERGDLSLVELATGRPLWTVKLPDQATTALVRKNYIFVGGRDFWAFDRKTGQLLDRRYLFGAIRRMDERSNLLYVIDRRDQMTVMDLDSRRTLYTKKAVRDFQYLPFVDVAMDAWSEVRLLWPENGAEVGHLKLLGKRPAILSTPTVTHEVGPYFLRGDNGRMRLQEGRLFTFARGGQADTFRLLGYGILRAP